MRNIRMALGSGDCVKHLTKKHPLEKKSDATLVPNANVLPNLHFYGMFFKVSSPLTVT